MRLLFVNYEYPPLGGGGGVACRAIAAELARRHEVHVLTSAGPDLAAEETLDGVRLWRAPVIGRNRRSVASLASMLSFYPAALRLGRALGRRFAFDLVASWFLVPSGAVGAPLARRFGLPHAALIMGGDVYAPTMWYGPPRNPLLARLVARLLASADLRTAPSRDLVQRAREFYGCTAPIEVIPHGVDPPSGLERSAVAAASAGQDQPVEIVTVCRLVPRKKVGVLLQALAEPGGPSVRLTVIGGGPDRAALEAQAAALGIADRVCFVGFVDETAKNRLLARSDIFALVSEHEGFGLVYVEAMHHGLPVIAATAGGQADFLVDGATGFLVEAGAVEPLARAIHRLARDPLLRQRIAQHNRRVAQGLSVAAAAARYEALFANLLERRSAAA